MFFAIGVVAFPLIIWLVIVFTDEVFINMQNLLHVPSMIVLIAAMAVTLFMAGEEKTLVKAINAILFKKYKISHADKERAIYLFKMQGKVVMYASLLMSAISLFIMLGQLDDPLTIGPMLSMALLSIIYAAGFNIVFFIPAIYILQHRKSPDNKRVISEKEVINKLLELCYKKGISPEEILEATDIHFTSS